MFCKKCGTDVGSAKFCPNCGINQDDSYSVPNSDMDMGNFKKVNKIAYGLIAILLGGFGIHRFYSGKILSGIIYLLFCWTFIPTVLGIIEGIIALTKDDEDSNGNLYVNPDSFFI